MNKPIGRAKLYFAHAGQTEKLTELVKNALHLSHDEIRCTTVDEYGLPGGARTNEQLKREIHDSTAFIGLISAATCGSH